MCDDWINHHDLYLLLRQMLRQIKAINTGRFETREGFFFTLVYPQGKLTKPFGIIGKLFMKITRIIKINGIKSEFRNINSNKNDRTISR